PATARVYTLSLHDALPIWRRLEVLQLDAGRGEDDVTGQVHGVLLAGVQGGDLVFLHGQGAVVSGVCFSLHQGPGLVDGAGGEDRVREGDETDAGGRRGGGEAQEPRGGDEEGRGGAGEGVGAHIAFGGVASGGVGADPGDAVEGGA